MQYETSKKQKYGQGNIVFSVPINEITIIITSVLQAPSSNTSQKLALKHSTNRSRAHQFSSTTCSHKRGNRVVAPIKADPELPNPRIGIVLLTMDALRVNSVSTLFELNRRGSLTVAGGHQILMSL